MYLNNIIKNKEYKIKNINADELIKRRLYDIGIIKDSKIELLRVAMLPEKVAYIIDIIIKIGHNIFSISLPFIYLYFTSK